MPYSHARREQLAREQGFSSYREKRRAVNYARSSEDFQRITGLSARDIGGQRAANLDIAHLYLQAFRDSPKNDYSVRTRRGKPVVVTGKDGKPRGAKAKWIIDVAGYVGDADEWKRRYPKGVRSRE